MKNRRKQRRFNPLELEGKTGKYKRKKNIEIMEESGRTKQYGERMQSGEIRKASDLESNCSEERNKEVRRKVGLAKEITKAMLIEKKAQVDEMYVSLRV